MTWISSGRSTTAAEVIENAPLYPVEVAELSQFGAILKNKKSQVTYLAYYFNHQL
jgi:hypothetical protein